MTTTATKRLIDIQEVKRAYDLLVEPGQVIELRALDATIQSDRRALTYSGYFDNFQSLQNSLKQLTSAMGVYLTLQPCMKELMARKASNMILPAGRDAATPDKYITSYRWLLIDCDPDRASGISSTDQEHETAIAHSKLIAQELAVLGFPAPIQTDSGNGAHLLYRIDLEVKESDLVKRVLAGLAERYNLPNIHIDQGVFNPARICKFYGTLACKGSDNDQRPHRKSYIVDAPEHLEIVSRELLEIIAMSVPTTLPTALPKKAILPYPQQYKETFTAETFLQKHHISVKRSDPYNGGTRYHLEECVWDSSHTDNSACVYEFADGRLGASCSHDSCSGKGWKELRLVFEPDAYTIKSPTKQAQTVTSVEQAEEKPEKENALSVLMRLAEKARYINTPSGLLFARVPVNGHYEIVSINEHGSGFVRWITHQYKKERGTAPPADALTTCMRGVAADAEYEGEKAKIYNRIAPYDDRVYLDLANEKWECIEISPKGWKIIQCPPVYFRRTNGMLPLPYPTKGGSLDDIKQVINAKTSKDYMLLQGWAIGVLQPHGPYPVLNLNGERGSTKTKASEYLRRLIDPNIAPTRSAPRDVKGIAIMAENNMILALDNLSSMPLWLSDSLCRVATGAGDSDRMLYTDDQEVVFNNCRPIILNGIEDGIISQGDLLSRAIMVTLEPPKTYKTARNVEKTFNTLHPGILGALLDAASVALRNIDSVEMESLPRMADFAQFVASAEEAIGWERNSFIKAFTGNQDDASSIILEASPVARAIVQFFATEKMRDEQKWSGSTQDLFDIFNQYEVFFKPKHSPKNARSLSGQLKRIASAMRVAAAIEIQQPARDKKGTRVILQKIKEDETTPPDDDPTNNKKGVANESGFATPAPSFATPEDDLLHQEEQNASSNDLKSVANVAGVAKMQQFSYSFSQQENEKYTKKENEEKSCNFATPATPATPEEETGEEKAMSLFNQASHFLETPSNGEVGKNGERSFHWKKKAGGYAGGFISYEQFEAQLWEMITSGSTSKIGVATEIMCTLLNLPIAR